MEDGYLYENTRYFVDVELEADDVIDRDGACYTDYYIVVSKLSGVVEFKTSSLVEAISGAAMADATLEGEPWKFYYTQAAANDMIPGEDGGGSLLQ